MLLGGVILYVSHFVCVIRCSNFVCVIRRSIFVCVIRRSHCVGVIGGVTELHTSKFQCPLVLKCYK